jgi:3-oxoacyl-[acyl-carrier protein] reductase
MRFEGKTAIVTGGSRGIGRACVARLAAEGAKVVLVYHSNQQAAEALVAELKGSPGEVRAVQADVRDFQLAHQVVDPLFEEWGHVDVLINSAGIVRDGLLGAMTEDQWRSVIETNLGGTFNYCHAVTQPMMMMRRGSIVNMSSTAAEFAARGQVNYAASKGGINGLTRSLAKELAPRNIRVNAIAPGMIETDMSQVVRGIAGDQIKKMIPLKRIGSPEEIAAVAAFLASDDAAYLTGQVLRVDGGLSLGGY